MIAKPGSVKTYKRFEAEIYVLTKDEGGRHTAFFSNYRPQFYLRTADVTGKVELPEDVKMVMPGDNVTAVFELITPVPLDAGSYRHVQNKTETILLSFISFQLYKQKTCAYNYVRFFSASDELHVFSQDVFFSS